MQMGATNFYTKTRPGRRQRHHLLVAKQARWQLTRQPRTTLQAPPQGNAQPAGSKSTGRVLAANAAEIQGRGSVVAKHAAETQGKGGVLAKKATKVKGSVFAMQGSGNTRQR